MTFYIGKERNDLEMACRCRILVSIILLALCSCNDKPDIIIRNVRLFDGEKVIENSTVSIKDGIVDKITNQSLSESAKLEIDGAGKTLIPGLINAHVHLTTPRQLKETMRYGIFTVIDLFSTSEISQKLRTFRDSINYSFYYSSGPVATVRKGHGTQFGFETPTINNSNHADEFIHKRISEGSDFIKIILESGTASYPMPTLSDSTFTSLVKTAQKNRLKTIVHISEKQDALKAKQQGANGISHIWSKNNSLLTDEELTQLSSNSFFIIPTLLVLSRASAQFPELVIMEMDQIKLEIKKLHDAGILILAGTDCPNLGIDCSADLFEEMLLLKDCGLSALDVLKAATSNAAKSFDLQNVGFVEEGAPANLILINGNPLDDLNDIRKIIKIWKKGIQITPATE